MITLKINGESHSVDVDPATPLLWVIRDYAGLTGTKFGCGIAQGIGLRSAVEGIARNPESSGKVTVTMLIGLALIESLCIYALVVALILIFAHPQAASIAALFAS